MLPVQGIAAAQQINPLYLPGNTFYVFSVERITFDGSQKRDIVFGGTSLPRFVFVPIVDFPQMGKNYAPIQNYALAQFEVSLANQINNAARVDGGLPMARKLAIHCVEEIIENYRRWGVTELGALFGLSRDDVARIYTAVLPPYITKPGLEAVKRGMTVDGAGNARFLIDEVRLLNEKGKEFEPDLHQLLLDVTGKNYNPSLPAALHEAAAKVQEAIALTIERAIEHRQTVMNTETAEVAASKTNGGKGQTSYSNRAKRYAASLGVELVDPVYVQKKEEAPAPAAPAPVVEIPGLTDAMNSLAGAIDRLNNQSPVPVATVETSDVGTTSTAMEKPATNKQKNKQGNAPKE